MKKRIIALILVTLLFIAGCGATQATSPDGPGPNGESIKGNINKDEEKIYHMPGQKYYEATNPEEWFSTEEEAEQAGYRKSKV